MLRGLQIAGLLEEWFVFCGRSGKCCGFSGGYGQFYSLVIVTIDDTVCAVVERPTVVLRVAGSILSLNKYLYGLQVVVPGLVLCDFSMFVNASTIQEIF